MSDKIYYVNLIWLHRIFGFRLLSSSELRLFSLESRFELANHLFQGIDDLARLRLRFGSEGQ
jgi:hypothetical protein